MERITLAAIFFLPIFARTARDQRLDVAGGPLLLAVQAGLVGSPNNTGHSYPQVGLLDMGVGEQLVGSPLHGDAAMLEHISAVAQGEGV